MLHLRLQKRTHAAAENAVSAAADARLTAELANRVMGWRVAPGRFLKSRRGWIPTWRFAPLKRLDDAFQLLESASYDYTLAQIKDAFTAEVRIGDRIGNASGRPKARAITLAVARALGLDLPG
jgi:hypothetical protein